MSDFPRPSLAADCVVLAFDGQQLRVLLIRRGNQPFAGRWALPGGFVEPTESVERAAARELAEETGLTDLPVEQLGVYSEPGRDPRGWVVSVAHLALVRWGDVQARPGDDAAEVGWVPVRRARELAFDHDQILEDALRRVASRARAVPFGAELLPEKLTLGALHRLHEAVLAEPLDKRNFRKRVVAWPALVPLDEKERGVPHRAARFYRFDRRKLRPFAAWEPGED